MRMFGLKFLTRNYGPLTLLQVLVPMHKFYALFGDGVVISRHIIDVRMSSQNVIAVEKKEEKKKL